MSRQKGQTLVEFAFIFPMFICIFLSIIYIGILFLDYTQYNNAARDAARDISLVQVADTRDVIIKEINEEKNTNHAKRLERYANPLTTLYTPTWKAEIIKEDGKEVDVQVTINLKLTGVKTGSYLKDWGVLPEELIPIVYKMRLEEAKS